MVAVWKVVHISQDWTKMFPIRKDQVRREKTNSYIRGNQFGKISKIPENFDIKHLSWSKIDLSKEIKKGSKERFSASFRSVVLRCSGAPISAQVFSCQFWKICKSTYCDRLLLQIFCRNITMQRNISSYKMFLEATIFYKKNFP